MKRRISFSRERGYFLFIAVILILVIGLMGSLITYLFANRAQLSVAQQNGLKAFYIAESGIEIGTRLLTIPNFTGPPNRFPCSGLNGTGTITNAALNGGAFTITTINSSPIYSIDTLSAAISSTSTSLNLGSSAGFAPNGRVVIDREQIDYTAISGNSLIGLSRGVGGSMASSHASGAGVGQYQCALDVQAGVPNLTSATYKRELQWNVQLQEGWTVGNASGSNFVFSRWNRPTEESWTVLNLAGGTNAENLMSVSMLSNADGWAVGDRSSTSMILLRWNGSSWTLNAISGSCSGQDLTGVSMISSQEGWAVGGRYRAGCSIVGNYRFTVLRWNGSSWGLLTPSTSPSIPADASNNQNLTAVHVIDTTGNGIGNIGFAVGDAGVILRYNGTQWTKLTSPTTTNLTGVYTVSATEAWAVGANGVMLRWNGSTWSLISSPTTTTLNAIAMYDPDGDGAAEFGLAVGNSSKIATYNGTSWSIADVGSNNLFGVAIINDSDAWAVGANGAALHWDGSSWTNISTGTTRTLNSVSVIAANQNSISTWRQVFP